MKWLLIAFFSAAAIIVGISWFLAPDSLLKCGQSPGDAKKCHAADAVIAVSGGDTSARTQQAIDLYKQGWAPLLIFSGAALDKSGPSNASVMQTQALKQGVPKEAIIIEEHSATTRENAENTSKILRAQNVEDAIVVSSSYHMKRTLLEFRDQSPKVNFRAHPTNTDEQWSVWWWTTPRGWYLALSEVVKIAAVHLGESR